MIYNKFINCPDLATLNSLLESGDITNQHIVFIQDIGQIWTMGTFYSSSNLDESIITKLTNISNLIITDGDGNSYLSNDGSYKSIDEAGYYNIPYQLLSLSGESVSQDVVTALGSAEEFNNICNAINSGKQLALYNDADHNLISLNSFTEGEDNLPEGGGQLRPPPLLSLFVSMKMAI